MTTLRQYLLIVVAAFSVVFLPSVANAQYTELYCNNSGGVGGGQLYLANQNNQTGACQFQGIQHIFSQIACNFVVILNTVLGPMYCGIQFKLTPILSIVLSLYVLVFGAQVLMGTAQLNSKDIVIRLLKIAGVWTFATQASWGVGIIIQFFFAGAAQGATWVLTSINPSLTAPQPTPNNFGNFMVLFNYLDGLVYSAMTGPFTQANNKVIGFFIVLMFVFPSLFTMACTWLYTTMMMLADTLIDFLLCLSVITFLIGLSPIFFSFMLFQATSHLFEDWLKYLISYTLQIVVVTAVIALWIATMNLFGGFFSELSNLVWPNQQVAVTNVFSPSNTYGLCKYTLSNSPPGHPGQACVAGLPCLPSMICQAAFDPASNNPAFAAAGMKNLIPVSQLLTDNNFISFMAYNLIALIIISYLFSELVKKAPELAIQLSGPATVPALGGGFGARAFGQAGGIGTPAMLKAPSGSGNPIADFLKKAGDMVGGRDNKKP